jgi:hypothetical protein
MSRLLDSLSTRRKLFDVTSKQAIHVVRGVSLLTRVGIRFSLVVVACDAAQHLAPDRVPGPIKANRMSFALLTTKCSDAIRLKIFLEDFLLLSPKTKTPLVGAAFTFPVSASFTPSL